MARFDELTPMQQRIVEILGLAEGWLTRQQMYDRVDTTKGYSKALGAPTGQHHPECLEELGLVSATRAPIHLSTG